MRENRAGQFRLEKMAGIKRTGDCADAIGTVGGNVQDTVRRFAETGGHLSFAFIDEGCGLDQLFDSRALKVSCFPNSGHLIGGFEFLLFGGPELEMASENFIDIRGRETLIGEISLDIDPVDSGNVSKLINGKAAFFDVFS